jgi:hypothetical protein
VARDITVFDKRAKKFVAKQFGEHATKEFTALVALAYSVVDYVRAGYDELDQLDELLSLVSSVWALRAPGEDVAPEIDMNTLHKDRFGHFNPQHFFYTVPIIVITRDLSWCADLQEEQVISWVRWAYKRGIEPGLPEKGLEVVRWFGTYLVDHGVHPDLMTA